MMSISPARARAAILLAAAAPAAAFLYQPRVGQIWDPSCFAIPNGTFFCLSMYTTYSWPHYTSGWLSSSSNGAHWRDVGPVASAAPGTQWWKGFVLQLGNGSYVMNHGVFEHNENDALRILTSTDLLNWSVAATSYPGAAYKSTGRWDHMYMAVDPSAGPSGPSYIGYAVSSPLLSSQYAGTWPGVQRSVDAVHWVAGAPLAVDWGGLAPQSIEEGGFERLELPGANGSGRYFLIGGGGAAADRNLSYSMWVFSSDSADGPYRPQMPRFRLSGGGSHAPSTFEWGALAAWCRGRGGERLISQYATAAGKGRGNVWMLPLRKPVVDRAGDLRLGYWPGNDALLGATIAGAPPLVTSQCGAGGEAEVRWFFGVDASLHDAGVYLNATLRVSGGAGAGAAGLALEDVVTPANASAGVSGGYTAVLLDVGADADPVVDTASSVLRGAPGHAPALLDRSGGFECGGDGGGGRRRCRPATLTALEPDVAHAVLLFFRKGMWELYVDALLVQTYNYGGTYPLPEHGAGRVGLACSGRVQLALSDLSFGRLETTSH